MGHAAVQQLLVFKWLLGSSTERGSGVMANLVTGSNLPVMGNMHAVSELDS